MSRPTPYLLAAAGISAAVGGAGALLRPGAVAASWLGAGSAWLVQAAAFLWLERGLGRGDSALLPWVGGMALRLGGLGALALVTYRTPLEPATLGPAYLAALLLQMGLEGAWLLRREGGASPGGRIEGRGGPERSDGRGRAGSGARSGAGGRRDRPERSDGSDRSGGRDRNGSGATADSTKRTASG